MKTRVLSILVGIMMLCSLLPALALAAESTATLQYINKTGGTEADPTFGFGDKGGSTMGVYISGSGAYAVTEDFSDYATIINGASVTIDGRGAVNTENVYIFGEGSLTVGDVVFKSGHSIAITDDPESSVLTAVATAVATGGSDVVNVSGTIAAETELVVYKATVASGDKLTFAGANAQLTIGSGGSLAVVGTVEPAQDARITALAGVTISGITLYNAEITESLGTGSSYTVPTENVEENYAENFCYLVSGENGETIQKWVRMVDEGGAGDPYVPQNNEYWFEYDWRDSAAVTIGKDNVPSKWSGKDVQPINFTTGADISFTLTPPQDNGTYSPVVKVEVFDGNEKTQNTIKTLTATEGTYTYAPESTCGFVVRVWWTEAEYDYDVFGPLEGEIMVEVMINGSENATVTSATLSSVANDKKISVGTKTKYILANSTTSLVLKITPGTNEQVADIIVGWTPQTFTAKEDGSVEYTWDVSGESNRYFEAVFGGTSDGEPAAPSTPGAPTAEDVEVPISGDDDTIQVGASVSGDKAVIDEVDLSELNNVIGDHVDGVGTVTIDFSGLKQDVDTVEIPADVVKEIADAVNDPANDAESLEIVLGGGVSIEFDAAALKEKASQAEGADITISIEGHEDADLTDAQKDAVGNRPAFDITVTSGGEHISDMGGKITIGAPYELKPNEKENGLVVWYVDDKGNRERCQGGYDPINKRMKWVTDHLSLYMIDYCPSATFTDLDIDEWYADATDYVIENGLMYGIGGGKFDPSGTTSRAMIVTILWRLEGEPSVEYAMDFEDVVADRWYTEAIRWAAESGVVFGYGNGKFGPNDALTREQMATIMFRYARYKGYDVSVGESTNILSYGDAFDVADWAMPAMQWACGSDVIRGIADGGTMNLEPQGNATRAQAAVILQRFCENVAKD